MRQTLFTLSALLIFLFMFVYSFVTVNATELPPYYFEAPLCDGGDSCPGKIFEDMPKAGHWSHDPIDWAIDTHVTQGTSDTAFSPAVVCNRAQIVTFLWRAKGSPAPSSGSCPFVDVPQGSYYYDAVRWAVQQGITKGTSQTTFSPRGNCTRAQIVTFLWRAAGTPKTGSSAFTDVSEDTYYAQAVAWAVGRNITKGTSETSFSPSAVCTRAQAVTFLYRWLKN